ncbi:MAG TPA: tetratricopeptide repeat protein [Candidatus Angelobacter sp.]|nr:tetratricopeptide repeat protein [Candidatus Angelobacter sp.]
MNRFSRNVLTVVLLYCAVPLLAQTQAQPQNNPLPNVAPPPAASTAQDLETTGDGLRAQKDYLDAIDSYRSALGKNETAVLHNKMGVAWLQLSKYVEARKEFQQAVRMDGASAEAHNNLGVSYYVNHQYGPAVKEYRRAIKLNANSAPFHSNLGSAYFSRKEFDKATKEYAVAMQLDPSIFDPTPSGGVSVKLATQGDRAYFHYVIAKMYGNKGDAEHCRLYLSKANEEGYPRVKDALKDQEFAVLRKDPAFVEFVRSLKPPPALEANN